MSETKKTGQAPAKGPLGTPVRAPVVKPSDTMKKRTNGRG